MIKGVVFDFDGTLADSSEGIFHTALYTVRALGDAKEYGESDLRKFVGPPLRDCFRIAFDLDPALIDDALRIYRKEYLERGYRMMSLYPGMKELLLKLRSLGIRTGVATFKGEELVHLCLQNLGVDGLFDSIHGSNEAENRTKGDIIRLCISDFGIGSDEVLMVGDTLNDLKGAEDAGTPFLAVRYGFGFSSCSDAGDIPYADDTDGIYGYVQSINGGEV